MRGLASVLALLGVLVVAGCGGGEKVSAIYELSAMSSPPVSRGTRAQILVPEPRALEALNTSKIAVKPTELTLSYYPEVAYQDVAPRVLQRVLLDTFQNTGRVDAVGLPGQSLLINYQIVTEVRAFQVETYGSDRARVEVSVKLLNDSNGRVMSSRIFDTVVPISNDQVETAAAGMNQAVQRLAVDVVNWTLAQI
ncbi:ABC-type transport auxiliary lipoprotein family protein [Acuticoccus kandeliae]|uniref:ABC-type transport auxiliary lipoprotein family protein n=1 Tax=Acuticoccus kandeliae TaxID=2073160 RepID=UPI000D3EAC44|nr:ABC-type transport auxiliary lipoprotein family protein [Acuticoccus kandeliae]